MLTFGLCEPNSGVISSCWSWIWRSISDLRRSRHNDFKRLQSPRNAQSSTDGIRVSRKHRKSTVRLKLFDFSAPNTWRLVRSSWLAVERGVAVHDSFEAGSSVICGNGQVDWRLINDHKHWMLRSLHMIIISNGRWGKLRFVTFRTMNDNSLESGTKEGSRLTGSCTTLGWNGWKLCVYRKWPYSNILLWSSLHRLCLNSFCAYE